MSKQMKANLIQKVMGIVVNVSMPKVYSVSSRMKDDYFHVDIETVDSRSVKIYLSTSTMGTFNLSTSKIFFLDPKKKKMVKHQIANAKSLMGRKVEITGHLETRDEGFYMNRIQSLVLL